MTTHFLKCWPGPFQATLDGIKRFEYRVNDRDFQSGDTLFLREWDPNKYAAAEHSYTGRELAVRVTYILHSGRFGLPDGYCVMSVEPVEEKP